MAGLAKTPREACWAVNNASLAQNAAAVFIP